MQKIILRIILAIILCIAILPTGKVNAQGTLASGPIYIVREGDNLWDIAFRFHVSLDSLKKANGITDADQISIGQQLVIPGLEGVQGILTTETVPYGESLQSLSLRYKLTPQILKQLNHIISPDELYTGYSLVILQTDHPVPSGKRLTLQAGQSLLELAVLNDTDPWSLMATNELENSWLALPGDVLHSSTQNDDGPGALPVNIEQVDVPKMVQGQTAQINISGETGLIIHGELGKWKLNFFNDEVNNYTALQGIHAMAEPGLYPLTMHVEIPDGTQTSFSQMVMVQAGDFLYDRSLPVDPATLDPETNRTENELWAEAASGVTPQKMWLGEFGLPVDPAFAGCYTSHFGNRRSYNGGPYDYFHTGIDFCGQVGDPIYAAAAGIVVYTGALTVRGNATMIDHGRGIFTAYMHQSEILVKAGDHVEEGQLIGRVGNTGRADGPHLHFEVLVGGVQVDPLEWLAGNFP